MRRSIWRNDREDGREKTLPTKQGEKITPLDSGIAAFLIQFSARTVQTLSPAVAATSASFFMAFLSGYSVAGRII
jgi:hypothetical protein